MDRHVIQSARSSQSSSQSSSQLSAPARVKAQRTPWWQLYSALIVILGIGVVIAFHAPALLNNPVVLLIGIAAFFGFVLVWCNAHDRELEAEPWRPQLGRDEVNAIEPSAADSTR